MRNQIIPLAADSETCDLVVYDGHLCVYIIQPFDNPVYEVCQSVDSVLDAFSSSFLLTSEN